MIATIEGVTGEVDVRQLYAPLRERALARVQLALKVAVLSRAGVSRRQMAERLAVSPGAVRAAIDDLREIAPQIELGERPGDQ